jgi:hypothetical protein
MNEQNITILNEKQDRTMKNIMEHIKDRIKCQNIAIRFRNTEKTLLANAIISNKNVKIIITDKALIKEISKNLKDIQNKVWGRSLFALFYMADNLTITKSLGTKRILEYKKATKYLELDTESNDNENECINLITEINILKNINECNINTIRIIKNNSLAEITKDTSNEMTIDCFNILNDIININYQRTATGSKDMLGLYMTRNDKFSVIIKDKLKASELYHKLSFWTEVLNIKFEFMKTIAHMIYKILDNYIKTNENNILENHLIQNNLAGEITSKENPIPISFDKAVNFQNQLNYIEEKPLNKIQTIIEYEGAYIKAYQSKNYIAGTLKKEPNDISLINTIADLEKTFGVNTFYYIRLTYNNCIINIKNTAKGILIEGISKNQLLETDIKKINQNKISVEEIKICKQKPTIKLKYNKI